MRKMRANQFSASLGDAIVSNDVCKFGCKRFKDGDFDLTDRQRSGAPRKSDGAIEEKR